MILKLHRYPGQIMSQLARQLFEVLNNIQLLTDLDEQMGTFEYGKGLSHTLNRLAHCLTMTCHMDKTAQTERWYDRHRMTLEKGLER